MSAEKLAWTKPTIEEVEMNAEIGGYQRDSENGAVDPK